MKFSCNFNYLGVLLFEEHWVYHLPAILAKESLVSTAASPAGNRMNWFAMWSIAPRKRCIALPGCAMHIHGVTQHRVKCTCCQVLQWHQNCIYLGLGSISAASSDRQSRTIDVHHERTSIAELDTAPPTSIVFPTPKTQKNLPYSLKWQRRWGGVSRPPLKLYHDRYYRAQ